MSARRKYPTRESLPDRARQLLETVLDRGAFTVPGERYAELLVRNGWAKVIEVDGESRVVGMDEPGAVNFELYAKHLALIDLDRTRRDQLAADAQYTTALLDLEQSAANRMPVDTLLRRVTKVYECEMWLKLATERLAVLESVRDGGAR